MGLSQRRAAASVEASGPSTATRYGITSAVIAPLGATMTPKGVSTVGHTESYAWGDCVSHQSLRATMQRSPNQESHGVGRVECQSGRPASFRAGCLPRCAGNPSPLSASSATSAGRRPAASHKPRVRPPAPPTRPLRSGGYAVARPHPRPPRAPPARRGSPRARRPVSGAGRSWKAIGAWSARGRLSSSG